MEFEIKEEYKIDDLLRVVEMLRDRDNGCPWDMAQTHKTIRKNFIEETYEAVEAIDNEDTKLLKEELGDVLLQVLLHAQFEAEVGAFDFNDVVDGISKKLILRHPHIFKNIENDTIDGVLQRWEEIKKEEKGHTLPSQAIAAVPKTFPALMYAQKVQKRAVDGGLDRQTTNDLLIKIQNDIEAISKKLDAKEDAANEIGKVAYHLAALSSKEKYDMEELLVCEISNKVRFFKGFENLLLQNSDEFAIMSSELFKNIEKQAVDEYEKIKGK